MIKNDYSKASKNEFDLKPEDDYEVIIADISDKHSSTGNVGLNFKLKIRTDVENPAHGMLFYTMWKNKNPAPIDKEVDGFPFKRLMWLAQTAGLQDGKSYEDFDSFLDDFIGKPLKVEVTYREYNGKLYETVSEIMKSDHPEITPDSDDNFAPAQELPFLNSTSITSKDLPF